MMSQERFFSLPSPPPEARHRTIAFTSGKGGVGKSSLVLNTALLLARRGRRVAILDGDLGLANLTVLLRQTPRHDVRHVIAGEKRLDEILVKGPHGLLVIPAGSGVAELANLSEEDRGELLSQLGELEESLDFLLIDTGAGLSDTVLTLVMASDESVVVTVPEPTAMAAAYALMKVVIQETPAYPFHLLINMVRGRQQGEEIYRTLSEILVKFLGYNPGNAGYVVTDPAVHRAVVEQVPFTIRAPRSEATLCLETLTNAMLGGQDQPAHAIRRFWERMAPRAGRTR
jgi:flagellar biosynthesis protein FlhG